MSHLTLVIRSGDAQAKRLTMDGELLLGRDGDGDGRLSGDPKISRRHARVKRRPEGGLSIEDLNSANGTLVNGRALRALTPRLLEAGDRIEIGDAVLEVAAGDPARAEQPRHRAGDADRGPRRTPRQAAGPEMLAARREPARPIEQAGSPSSLRPASSIEEAAGAAPPPAELLRAGRRVPIPPQGLAIGRGDENDVAMGSTTVSRRHARILSSEGRYFVADLGTRNGTLLNGERLRGESRWLNSGDVIEVGDEVLRFLTGAGTRIGGPSVVPARDARVVHLAGDRLTLGRDASNDVPLDDPNVSRFHAEIRRSADTVELRDLGSRNGTRLDHEFIRQPTPVGLGSEIGIGPFRLVFDGTRFIHRDDRGALRMSADEITTAIKGKVILNAASIDIEPGELVVIIGESGSGKTTMIKALAGVTRPTRGTVLVSGEPVLTRLTDIGYVPQDEIVHRGLTVLEALRYAAALRLPKDSSKDDIDAAVQRVLEELSLGEHAGTRIGSLSGGQRKRVGVGTELLNRPSLLFLDEPTTGLDPGLETRLMELFNDLAEPGKRAVTVVTHATKNLGLADKVCVMGQGGELSFLGPPGDAKEFFGVKTFDGIYTALEERPPAEWRREFEAEQARGDATAESSVEAPSRPPPSAGSRPRPAVGLQTSLLARRYAKLLVRDRRNLALLVGQVPLIALGIALLFHSNVFVTGRAGSPASATYLLFLVVTTAIWLGSIDGSREIIKERALMERERAVGVKISAYLSSKALVLFGLVAVQCVLLVAIVFGLRSLHEPAHTYALLLGILMLTGFVAVGMGLLISSIVSSEDQAASFIPLVLIPQLLFAGAIVSVSAMSTPISAVSNLVFARWSFDATGAAVDMTTRLGAVPDQNTWGDFFSRSVASSVLILVGFLVVFFGATYANLRAHKSG